MSMGFTYRVEQILRQKHFYILPLFISAIGALVSPTRLTDQHPEIVQAGTKWMYGSILYLQSHSVHSPQTLYIGYLYKRTLTNSFLQFLFELVLWLTISALVYGIARKIIKKNLLLRNALLLSFATMFFIPGIWQHGLADQKLGLLFVAFATYCYLLWKESSVTMWLFGTTAKNWRFLLLCGVGISLTIFTSWAYFLVVLPMLFDFATNKDIDRTQKFRYGALLTIPVLLESWVWISYLSSHRILSEYFNAQIIGLKESVHLPTTIQISLPIILPLLVFIATLVARSSGQEFRRKLVWGWSVTMLVFCAIWPAWLVYSCMACIPTILFIQNKKSVQALRPTLITTLAIFALLLSLPLRLLSNNQSKLETAQANLAIAYVEQRLMNSNTVTYYGRGAGIYELSGFTNPSRYSDLAVLAYDTSKLGIESVYRGDVEAETPPFVIVAEVDVLKSPTTPRLDQYLAKHYEKVADLDGYQILKRK